MTSLINLRTKQVVQTRLVTISGNKRAYATLTAAFVELQPVVGSKQEVSGGGAMNKLFNMYCDVSFDIQESDRLRETSNNHIYKVRTGGVSRRTQGSIDYTAVVVEQIN